MPRVKLVSWVRTGAFSVLVAAVPSLALAQTAPPRAEPAPLPPPIATPKDEIYPGAIGIHVDATDLGHHVFATTEILPVANPGALTLLFPKWLPGAHAPEGHLDAFAGLRITAGNTEIPWTRDAVNVYAFHLDVPPDTTQLKLTFQYLSPTTDREGDVVMTDSMLDLQWREEVLYPAGFDQRDITIHPSVTLPANWQLGTALTTEKSAGSETSFHPTNLATLLDSPLYAGRNFARIDLAPGAKTPVHLNVVADQPEDLEISDTELAHHRAMVQQAALNFASQHYDHFDFLLSLSDELTFRGLEHHRSSENGQDPDYFTNWSRVVTWHDLLPHEYIHSWDGKFRRPADLFSPDDNTIPERDTLLWVYEGQTEYWGQVIAARAGLNTPDQYRDFLALIAAGLQAEAGRTWRNMQDTTNDPIIAERRPLSWSSYSRAEDYYMEGALMWLDADTLIREQSHETKSLTTVAQHFFGVDDGSYAEDTYTKDDVVNALNAVLPADWRGFLDARLDQHPNTHLLDGITRAGWRLAFTPIENDVEKSIDAGRKGRGFIFSLGIFLANDGTLASVEWGSPAFQAGIASGVKLMAVNDIALDGPDTLADAIAQSQKTQAPLKLLLLDGKHYKTATITYTGGLRYPRLERISNTRDRLADILSPLK